jgi:hypothetical protein
MATNFAVPGNNVSTTVGATYTHTGSFPQSLTLAAGTGSKFPTLTGSQFYRVTVCQVAFAYSPTASTSNYTIYNATLATSPADTLTLHSVMEGTTDRDYAIGDIVEIRVTAGTLSDIHTAVNNIESSGTGVVVGHPVSSGTNNSVLYVDGSGNLADSGPTWNGSSFVVNGPASDTNVFNICTNSSNSNTLTLTRNAFTQKNVNQHYPVYTGAPSTTDPVWTYGQHSSSGNFYFSSWDPTNGFIQFFQMTPGTGVQFGNTALVTIRGDGSIVPVTMANASAANNSLFIDSSSSNQLCWKDGSGGLHHLT